MVYPIIFVRFEPISGGARNNPSRVTLTTNDIPPPAAIPITPSSSVCQTRRGPLGDGAMGVTAPTVAGFWMHVKCMISPFWMKKRNKSDLCMSLLKVDLIQWIKLVGLLPMNNDFQLHQWYCSPSLTYFGMDLWWGSRSAKMATQLSSVLPLPYNRNADIPLYLDAHLIVQGSFPYIIIIIPCHPEPWMRTLPRQSRGTPARTLPRPRAGFFASVGDNVIQSLYKFSLCGI